MSTDNIPFSIYIKRENHTKFPKSAAKGLFPRNELESTVVNEPSVFELLKFYGNSVFIPKQLLIWRPTVHLGNLFSIFYFVIK